MSEILDFVTTDMWTMSPSNMSLVELCLVALVFYGLFSLFSGDK